MLTKLFKPFRLNLSDDRIYGLDILRASAILFVVLLHSLYLLPAPLATFLGYFVLDGVSIFFVLSGFLIGGILIRTLESGNISFKGLLNFWGRRWLRTLPAYYFVLVLLCLLPASFTGFKTWTEVSYYFFFIQNFNTPHPHFFMEAWSLSVEEWFYLLIPFLLFLFAAIGRFSPRHGIVSTASIVIVASLLYRAYIYYHIPIHDMKDWDNLLRKQVLTRLDSTMLGVVGAWLCYYKKPFWLDYRKHFSFRRRVFFRIFCHICRPRIQTFLHTNCVEAFASI